MDNTENIRRNPSERELLEKEHGQVWTLAELKKEFEITGFMAPMVLVRRKSDGQRGSMYFQRSPRFYYGFQPE